MSQDKAFQSLEMPPMPSSMPSKSKKTGRAGGKTKRNESILQNNQIINNNQEGWESHSQLDASGSPNSPSETLGGNWPEQSTALHMSV